MNHLGFNAKKDLQISITMVSGSMTWGRKLWGIILVKLFIMFAILRLFFFPDMLKRDFNT